jgi:anaerobic C4-dicarboxylate transporter
MFIEAPLLSMLIIGLPSAILSIVCYCLCCLSNEASIEDREILYERMEEEDGEQKPTIEKKEN